MVEKPSQKKDLPKHLWFRLLALATFVLLVNSWSRHHLDHRLIQISLTGGPFILVGIISFLARLVEEEKTVRAHVRKWFLFFSRTPVLIILYVAFLMVGSFLSSVSVIAGGIQTKLPVYITHERDDRKEDPDGILSNQNTVVQRMKFTSPFGSPLYVNVLGYQRYSFDLFPWIGKKIRVLRDMEVSPSIIIRIPPSDHSLLNVGKIEIFLAEEKIAGAETQRGEGSVLFGQYSDIPNHFLEKWKIELQALDLTKAQSSRCFLRWLNPLVEKPCKPFRPGSRLNVIFKDAEGVTWAQASFSVGTAKIQDILLKSKEKEQ